MLWPWPWPWPDVQVSSLSNIWLQLHGMAWPNGLVLLCLMLGVQMWVA